MRPQGGQRLPDDIEEHAHVDLSQNLAPTPPGRSVGAPGNVQARGLNPAQPSDQKYAAGLNKVPYCMCVI